MSGIKDGRVGEREKVTSNERRKKEREEGERERERGRRGSYNHVSSNVRSTVLVWVSDLTSALRQSHFRKFKKEKETEKQITSTKKERKENVQNKLTTKSEMNK